MRVRARLSLNGFAGVGIFGAAIVGGSIAVAACASSDSSTHGFVLTDAGGNGNNMLGDDSSVGTVVTSGNDASNNGGGDDNGPDSSGDDMNGDDDSSTNGQMDGGSNGGGDTGTGTGADAAAAPHVCDGVIGATEYGGGASNFSYGNASTGTGQTWYMDWDATNLYIAVTPANVDEPLVLYVSETGKTSTGVTFGYGYDEIQPTASGSAPGLPFPANFVVFAKGFSTAGAKYSEYRLANGTSWSSAAQTSPVINVCVPTVDSGIATTREIVIPWNIMGTGVGLPSGFVFLGYLDNGNQSAQAVDIYGQVPTANPGGMGQNAVPFPHRFYVSSTADGGTAPFSDPN